VLQKILLLALAGGLGTLSRYGLAGLVQRWTGGAFPWGTLAVNLMGCFAFGVLWSLMEMRHSITGEVRAIILVGFMGAFTTFSTFIFESGALLQAAEWWKALGNLAVQNGAGLVCLFAGLTIGRWL